MTAVSSTDISNLSAALRLMEIEENLKARQNGKEVEEKSALDYFEEDKALISESAFDAQKMDANPLPHIENININLAELSVISTQSSVAAQAKQAGQVVTVQERESVEIEMKIRYRSNTPIDGLQVHDRHYAESDRYLFKFADGTTFTILDKWTNKSTTIWGDPHVDVDDMEGTYDGDFKDLKESEDRTTFMLADGTQVTFKAQDEGIIERVDIFKGSEHIVGRGQADLAFSPETGLFSTTVLKDGVLAAAATSHGDVIRAGGDGNDWFDVNNKLVWGKTTGPIVASRPSASLEFLYQQTVSRSITTQTIKIDA